MTNLLPLALIVLSWSTRVHHSMIHSAFPSETLECRAAMTRGSDSADGVEFQNPQYSYMHAMRSAGQSPDEAAKLMRKFVEDSYRVARNSSRDFRSEEQSCFYRGVALHPIMDATSPAHRGFQEWDPIPIQSVGAVFKALLSPKELRRKLPHMLAHGDLVKRITDHLPVLTDTSLEDFDYLDDHPQLLEETFQAMRAVDQIQFELMGELESN